MDGHGENFAQYAGKSFHTKHNMQHHISFPCTNAFHHLTRTCCWQDLTAKTTIMVFKNSNMEPYWQA
jgi:hypothetical protein